MTLSADSYFAHLVKSTGTHQYLDPKFKQLPPTFPRKIFKRRLNILSLAHRIGEPVLVKTGSCYPLSVALFLPLGGTAYGHR